MPWIAGLFALVGVLYLVSPPLRPGGRYAAVCFATAAALLANPPSCVYERSLEFGYDQAAARLIASYERA